MMSAPMPSSRQSNLPKPIPSMGNNISMMRDHHSPTPREYHPQISRGQGPPLRFRMRSNSPHRSRGGGSQPSSYNHHYRTPTPPPPQDYSYQYTDIRRHPEYIKRETSYPPKGSVVGRGESIRSRGRGRSNPRGGTSVRGGPRPGSSTTFSAPPRGGRTNVAERLGPKVKVADRLGRGRGRGAPPKHHDANNMITDDYSTHEISNQEPQRPSTSFDSDRQVKNLTKRYAHMMLC